LNAFRAESCPLFRIEKWCADVRRYITALYWGMSTLCTVGYGDVTPMNSAEKLFSMLAMVIGVTVFAYFMGTIAALITSMNSTDNLATHKVRAMDTFLRARRVPAAMVAKIRKFHSKAVKHHVLNDEEMVSQLSIPLRTELLLFLYRNTLEKIPFFKVFLRLRGMSPSP
jgi:voltage-gated potassium channel